MDDKTSIFRGQRNVSNFTPVTSTVTNNQEQSNSETMTSTTTNDNSIPVSPSIQRPISVFKTGFTSPLASLANATEPNSFSSNPQQPSVGTFPQRTTGASSTTNKESPFGLSFAQPSTTGSTTAFQITNSSTTNASSHAFPNTTSKNAPGLSFPNTTSGNTAMFNFTNLSLENSPTSIPNQSTTNSQVRQPISSFTFTSSKQQQQQQEISNNKSQTSSSVTSTHNSNQISTINEAAGTAQNNISAYSRKPSDPSTPISQQSSFPNQEQETSDAPASLADTSLLEKKINTKLRDPGALIVDRSDPTSPLYSLKSFQELNLKPDLLKGIYSMGFQAPSKIQEISLPLLLNNPPKNIIAQSQSGTGKTAAFSLAILSRIDPSIPSVQALILAPTYELAIQIGSVIEQMAKYLSYIAIAYAVRNTTTRYVRGQPLMEPIVIGTPGTVEDWCRRRRVIDLSKLRVCCVDEADVMIATEGFQKTCVDLVRSVDPSVCQMMLFSATYSDEVMTFAREIVKEPTVLRLKREKQTLNNIRQFFIRCYDPEHKYHAIEQIYQHLIVGQAMIFCRTKATARELAVRMAGQQHSVRELTAALDIDQRASVIRQFRDRVFNVLISTNVTARGIDIDDVSLVINYDMPVTVDFKPDYETYLHRIGRCGRFGKLGYTFNLIGSEKDFDTMRAIEEYFQHPITEITINDISNLEHDQE